MALLETLLIEYRWILVCLFLLPLSFLYNVSTVLRERLVFLLKSDPKQHNSKVLRAQRQMKSFRKALEEYSGERPILCTSRPGWQTMSFRFPKYKAKNKFQLNLENFVDVIEFNAVERSVVVEPMMSIRQINGYLLQHGYSLPIVPELDDLTIGGLVMGTGIESSSFRYGLFHRICLQFEMLLPDGEVIKCDKDNHPDLFHAVPWSYGTTGFLMSVRLQIIPVQKYIRLDYAAHETIDSFCSDLNRVLVDSGDVQFIEGLILNSHKYVLMTGSMTDGRDKRPGEAINRIGKWHKPWFYKHVDSVCFGRPGCLKDPHSELIPLMDYYHRHSRSIFWELEQIVPMGNNPLFRFVFGWMQPIKIGLLKLTQTAQVKELYEKNHLIQDLLIPVQYLKQSIDFFDSVCRIYPIWVCPFRLDRGEERGFLKGTNATGSESKALDSFYVDIGLYGVPGVKGFDPSVCTRAIEEKCREWNGFQMLYADCFQTRDEFHDMFNHDLYSAVRKKYKQDKYLPEVYDKINKNARI